jgi:hypothetical protein
VPFRDTKLTRLFADSLGGVTTGHTLMIVNAGPGHADFDETLHALKYGALVKEVRVTKDRTVTRWEPGAYDAAGRRVLAGDAAAAAAPTAAGLPRSRSAISRGGDGGSDSETGASTAPAAAASRAGRKGANGKPVAPAPLHAGGLKKAGSAHSVASAATATSAGAGGSRAAAGGRKASVTSVSSDISTTLISAALAGAVPPLATRLAHGGDGAGFDTARSSAAHTDITAAGTAVESLDADDEAALDAHLALAAANAAGLEAMDEADGYTLAGAGRGDTDDAAAEEWAAEREQLIAAVTTLSRQVAILQEELEDSCDAAAGVESEVREQVAEELSERLAAMEAEYAGKLAAQAARFEVRHQGAWGGGGGQAHCGVQAPHGRWRGVAMLDRHV